MRRALLGLLVLALLAPGAAASSFTLLADRHLDAAATGGVTVFSMPVQIQQAGSIYAKVLATEGNAVNDGYKANGSVEGRTGWRAAFAWVYANGTREELGSFVDGTPTALVPVAPESDTLVVTVRWPSDAQTVGGANQTVWVALAYRAPSSGGPGSTSGVSMDEAKAISLALHFGPGVAMDPAGTTASPPPSSTPPPATAAAPTPTPASPPVAAPGGSPESGAGEATIPPVGPIESTKPTTSIVVVPAPIPAWFLAAFVAMGLVSVASLALLAAGVWLLARRRPGPVLRRVTRVPVRVRDGDDHGVTPLDARGRER